MTDEINSQKIKGVLSSFFNHSWRYKDFLTEDDVRCRLFNFIQNSELKDSKYLSAHSEVRWYGDDNNKQLKYRSDIVLIDSTDIRDSDDTIFKLPSKGYGFNRYYCIIEIKLRRLNDKHNNDKYDLLVKSDLDKLREISERTSGFVNSKIYCVIVFDKKLKKKTLVVNVDGQDWIRNCLWQDWQNETGDNG